jgi:DNA polymerase I
LATKSLEDFLKTAEVRNNEGRRSTFNTGLPTNFQPESPQSLSSSYFVSATYDGVKKVVCIKLYEPETKKIYFWYDTTGHKPYCLTNIEPNELEKINRLTSHPGFDRFERIKKYDPLNNKEVVITKVVVNDPLAIGGHSGGSIRDIIPAGYANTSGVKQEVKVWEAFIRYYQSYIYDRKLAPGMIYKIKKGELVQVEYENSKDVITRTRQLFRDEQGESLESIEAWAWLLECPAPEFRRVALDIEVHSPIPDRIPNPNEATEPIICVSLLGSDGQKTILLLTREGIKKGEKKIPLDVTVEYYDREENLILKVFEALWSYPFVLTFNGDDFDLQYLWRRALNLGIKRDQIPIKIGRRTCLLKYGVHIDLYRFFFNRSIRIYAFNQKYRGLTLGEVGEALVNMSKLELSKPISDLAYNELALYCIRDAETTLKLTTFNDNLVMKLILALSRISRMPMEDVSRQGVSRWILNFLYYEHRHRNMLIPNADDILALKGVTATKAIIKGKKYKGAIVVEPTPGVHFNVAVMDFASLYPSIIKVCNLGYQSIRCSHEECKDNKVPETSYWICNKSRALESLLIGSLRDLRVKWYKPKSKDESLPKELRNWYDVIQSALKVILNASYGVFGAETFNLYCPPVAEATAAYGRQAITKTVEEAKKLGIDVLYGDTDSVFLKAPSSWQIEALKTWSEKNLKLDLDLEKTYRFVVLSSRKKNYLGIYPDGRVDVKGLTGKKRHIPELIEKPFNEINDILGKVKYPEEMRNAKRDIQQIVRECYQKLKQREFELNELAFNVVLGKKLSAYTKTTPQHVKAARLLQERGYEVRAGTLISFVKVVKKPNVKPVQLVSKSEVDIDKYVDYMQSTFDQIFDALDLDFNEIIGLTNLERWI